ncbi:MAG: guanylate kinase [Lachnospiraceae bacterium]|nr:guanylate kinase [Lachnospiraceae bacterium]
MDKKRLKRGRLLVISGFSGVGKGTVIKKLMEMHPEYAFSVSATTRAPRPGEVDGRDYFFIDKETFDRWVGEGRFLEYARFFNKAYGTLKEHVDALRAEGKNVILDIEVEGAENVCAACPDAISFYIIPPAAGELRRRIEGRGTETREQIRGRMEKAVREAEVVPRYRYIIVNDEVDKTAAEIHRLSGRRGKPRIEREKALELTKEIQKELKEILKDYRDCDNIN